MSPKKLQIITWIVIIGFLIGGLLGIYLIGKETGRFNYDLLLPICLGTFGGFLIFIVFSKFKQKRNGNVPDIDERSVSLIQKYFLIALYVILLASGAALLIAYSLGIEYIETGLLIFFFFDAVDFHYGGRVSPARLQPSPSLRSVRVLPLVLFPQKSPPPFQSTRTTFKTK